MIIVYSNRSVIFAALVQCWVIIGRIRMLKRRWLDYSKLGLCYLSLATLCPEVIAKSERGQDKADPIFSIEHIQLPHIKYATQITHKDRVESGGFSALWASADCSEFIFVSDYSQVNETELLAQPVKRSGWYHTQNVFDEDGRLIKLDIKHQGVLKHLNSTNLKGAAESITTFEEGFVISFDDTGDLWLYNAPTTNMEPQSRSFNASNHPLNQTPTLFIQQPNFGEGNAGLESIARLADGTFLSVWEKNKKSSDSVPVSIHKISKADKNVAITASKFTEYAAISSPKDLTVLNDGTVIVLEKDWLGKKGSRLRLSELHIDKMEQTNYFDHTSVLYDNFEGMASCTMNNKEWIFIVSDDNGDWPRRHFEDKGIPRQKTLLVGFEVNRLLNRN